MSVFNVIDSRSNEKTTRCDVVYEIDHHDWKALGLSKPAPDMTEWVDHSSVYDAIFKAMGFKGLVTVYLYDDGQLEDTKNLLCMIHPDIKDKMMDTSEIDEGIYQLV